MQAKIEHFTKNDRNAQFNDIINITKNIDINTCENLSLNVLKRLCLKFCIALLNHQINKHEYENALIYALIVLKIRENQ